MSRQNGSIVTARWDIYPNCNLNCLHCCAKELFDRKKSRFLDLGSAIKLLDLLWQNGITHLNILGGEPFLHPHVNTILQYACKQGFQIDVTTNGTTIRNGGISSLVGLGLRNIYFSLDGSSPHTNDVIRGIGSFRKVLATMQKFIAEKERQESSLQINVNTVLTKINASDIHNIVGLISSIGVNTFKLSHLECVGNASRHISRLYLKSEEEFNVAEYVMRSVPSHPELEFDILSSKPLFLEYFYEKYGVVFPIDISGCKACVREIHIDPAGKISPCLATSDALSGISNESYEKYRISIFELENKPIHKQDFYEEFKSAYPLTVDTYQNYIPCNSCHYLTTICYPCPLGPSNEVRLEELCLAAEGKLKELNAERQDK
jgi:MoaA/NifB/PqqE/SkfB family radical SAM enzyme